MPIDYSKWDKLEISDDEDFECHPNVDKASFIRWKQADIHQKREERRQKIEGLANELEQIETALKRIDEMTQQLQTEGVDSFLKTIERLREASEKIKAEREQQKKADDESEIPPDNFPQPIPPTFDEVMTILFEKIQKEVEDESKESVANALIAKLKIQREKYSQRQVEAKGELEKEQAEAKKKITMDDIHTGFDKSSVSKITKLEPPKPKPKHKKKTEKVLEVLNPNAELKPLNSPPKDDGDDDDGDGDEEMIISQISKEFAKIKDYHASYKFISEHPEIVDQEVVDQILAEAFQAELKHKSKYAKQCVHQAWLLQYCQKLGKDGVSLFFQRITSPQAKEQAREIFNSDVEETYKRITERCKVIGEERKQQQSEQPKQVEQIQIEVTDPGSNVRIRIPDAKSTDPDEQAKWQVYETLPQDLRDAFETGELSQINKVLGKMTVEDAEKMLELTGKAGVLSIEEGIIDTTKGETIADREKKVQQNVEMETDA